MKSLPNKPSELIALTVKDMELCAQDPRYRLWGASWHAQRDGRCLVCLAGSVMAQTIGVEPSDDVSPASLLERQLITDIDRQKLVALEDLRNGFVRSFLINVGVLQTDNTRVDNGEEIPYAVYHALNSAYCGLDLDDLQSLIPWLGLVRDKLAEIGL
jgi:hypothetical protein